MCRAGLAVVSFTVVHLTREVATVKVLSLLKPKETGISASVHPARQCGATNIITNLAATVKITDTVIGNSQWCWRLVTQETWGRKRVNSHFVLAHDSWNRIVDVERRFTTLLQTVQNGGRQR